MSSKPQAVETKSVTNNDPWGPQQPYIKEIFGEAQRLYNDPSRPQFFPGQTYASPSNATLTGLQRAEDTAMAGSPVISGAQDEASKILSGDYLRGDHPYMQGMIDRTAADVLPRVNAGFLNAGGPGGLQTRAATMALADSANSLRFQNYGAERANMMNTMNNAGNIAGQRYLDPAMLGQVGAQREAIAQQPITEAVARHEFDQNAPWGQLANYLQMIQGNYGGTSNTTGTQFLPGQNMFGNILGGLMGGAGILGGTGAFGPAGWLKFSDERLKEDIKRVGETDDGIPLYTYRYKGTGTPMMGPLAQEVAEAKPEAVAMMPNGYLAVDYSRL